MVYRLLRYPLWLLYICFFRRIYFIGADKIPKKNPVIFTSNHSNGFLEPLIIAVLQWRHIWFWVGASEIGGGFKGWLMQAGHSLPIYRQKEGKENMHKNEVTFQTSREVLYNGNTLYLAPEGRCIIHKELLPFKTGCARLAFKMMEEKNWQLDLKIIASGINYTYHDRFRSEVYVKFGKVLSVLDYKELYLQDNFAAVTKMTEDLREAIQAEMIYVRAEDEALTEQLLPMGRNNVVRGTFPIYGSDSRAFDTEQKIANYVGQLAPAAKEELTVEVAAYQQQLQQNNTTDYAVANKNKRSLFGILLGFPIWLVGLISGIVPHILSSKLTAKVVPYPEFKASFGITIALAIWFLYGLIVVGVGSIWLSWWALFVPFGMVATQFFAYHYQDYYQEYQALAKHQKVTNKTVLAQQRAAIMQQVLQNKETLDS